MNAVHIWQAAGAYVDVTRGQFFYRENVSVHVKLQLTYNITVCRL